MFEEFMNKKVIVRGDRSGVFFGTLVGKEGSEVKLANCRRLWYWDGAASISQIAILKTFLILQLNLKRHQRTAI